MRHWYLIETSEVAVFFHVIVIKGAARTEQLNLGIKLYYSKKNLE